MRCDPFYVTLHVAMSHPLIYPLQYEAVHPMSGWPDLRQRLDSHDRRVYAFVHPCLPGEPLVVLHTALTQRPVESVRGLVVRGGGDAVGEEVGTGESPRQHRTASNGQQYSAASLSASLASTGAPQHKQQQQPLPPKVAVFYSISSTQPGLSGVDLGHLLIKRVAEKVMVSQQGERGEQDLV